MAQEKIFDAYAYFERLGKTNKEALNEGFKTGFCSGLGGMQDMMANFKKLERMILIDDTTTQSTYSNGVGWFRKDVYTVFIVAGYRFDDMKDREEKLNMCRRLFRQFHSRLIHDQETMAYDDALEYLQVDSIYSTELPRYFMQGVTGLYFMVSNDEPIDLTYNGDEWEVE